ncbi:histone H1-like [Hypanus sabinus]|uniref:histone H1-like n=1 Tax=Hypanus sabinus TaxID=79690 RepID=UPI0028C48A9C|nr:histone H1-like [Hypanus sabinus]
MTETAPAETAPPAAPAAAKKTPKKKAAARSKPTGPSLGEQIDKIVAGCLDRKGMSGVAIMKALADSGVDVAKRRHQVKMSIKRKVESGSLVQAKGSGISGSFKSGKGKTAVKVVKKANKPAAKKSPDKKLGAKKPAAKKAGAKKPATKKAGAKKPAAKKAGAKKPAAKKAAAKKPAAKKAAAKKPAAKKAAPKPKSPKKAAATKTKAAKKPKSKPKKTAVKK